MGCCSSSPFHEDEKGVDDKEFMILNYSEQPEDEYKQLDTENDQYGDTAVEHIFKKTKCVFLYKSYILNHIINILLSILLRFLFETSVWLSQAFSPKCFWQ